MPDTLIPGETVRVGEGVRKGDVYEYLGLDENGVAQSRVRWKYTSANHNAPGLNKDDLVKVDGKTVAAQLDAQTVVDDGADTITFQKPHGFSDGDLVTYQTTIDQPDDKNGGLQTGTYYSVEVIDDHTIKLHDASTASVIDILQTADWSGGSSAIVTTTPGIYKYIGDDVAGSVDLADSVQHYATDTDNWVWVDASNLSTQDYGDTSLWKQIVNPSTAQVQAFLADTSVNATGALTVAASTTSTIDALVIAAAAAVGGGAAVGVGASVAGSYGSNRIATDVNAYIDGDGPSGITAYSIAVTADDSSGINAIAGGISVAGAIGITGGAGALSVGLSLAFNQVGNNVNAYIANADQHVTSTSTDVVISSHTQGRLLGSGTPADFTADDLNFASKSDSTEPGRKTDATPDDPNNPDDTSDAGAKADAIARMAILQKLRQFFLDLTLNSNPNPVALAIYDSAATPAMYKTDVANPDGTHQQDLRYGDTVEIGQGYDDGKGLKGRVYRYIGSDTSLDLSTRNYQTDTTNWMLVDKLKVATVVEGLRWVVLAPDGSSFILEKDASTGEFTVTAATINAVSAAGSLALGIGGRGVGIAVAGAGAVSQNVIQSSTRAYGQDSIIMSNRDVLVNAESTAEISSFVLAAAVGIGAGVSGGVGAAVGVAITGNYIGFTPDGAAATGSEIKAYLKNSSVTAQRDLLINATASETIASIVIAGAVAIGAGGLGIGGAGTGISAVNHISVKVSSYIDGDGATGVTAHNIKITANDTSTIRAIGAAVAVAFSYGFVSVSVAVGVTIAENTIGNVVQAYVSNADTLVNSTVTGLEVKATETSSISAVAVAAAAAVAIGDGLAAAGAGVQSVNAISNAVEAYILDSANVLSAGALNVLSSDTASISAIILSVAISAGMIGISVGVLVADNKISDTISAYIKGSTVTAQGADIIVSATSTPSITTASVAAAFSLALGGAAAGASSVLTIETITEAYIDGSTLHAVGHVVQVHSTSTSVAKPTVASAAVGALAIATLSSESYVNGTTRAYTGGVSTIDATTLDIHATDTNTSTSKSILVGGGAITGTGATSKSVISRDTKAYIADGAHITAGSAGITLKAETASNSADGEIVSVAVGGFDISIVFNTVDAGGTTSAFIGASTDVTAASFTATALANNTSHGQVDLVGVGGITGSGVTENVKTTAVASAYLAPTGKLTVKNNGVDGPASFTATMATNTATAEGTGISVGLGAVQVVDVQADAGGTAKAYVAGKLNASTLNLTATSTNIATPETTAVTVGLGLAVTISKTIATISQTTDATLKNGADVTLSGAAVFSATSTSTPTAHTEGVSIGTASGAAQFVTTNLGGTTKAGSETGAKLFGTTLSATATSTNGGATHDDVSASFVGVSFLGGSGAKLSSNVTQSTDSSLGGMITLSGAAMLTATSTSYSIARNSNVSVSGLSITVLDIIASLAGTTTAGVADSGTLTAASLTATATGNATATAETIFKGFSVGGGAGSKTTSTLTQTVNARIGKNATVSLGSGAASLTATGTGTSNASDSVLTVSAFSVSAMTISASTGGAVNAFVDDGASVTAGSVTLGATGTQTPTATHSSIAVGLLTVGIATVGSSDTTAVSGYVGSQAGSANPTSVNTTGAGGIRDAAGARRVD